LSAARGDRDVLFAVDLVNHRRRLGAKADRSSRHAIRDPTNDLQTWMRNDGTGALAPDWPRIGKDITHQWPFNGTFELFSTTGGDPLLQRRQPGTD
jgi:hypothetical protein